MAQRPCPSLPLRIVTLGITSSITRQSWQRQLLGTLAELVVIVKWLGFTSKAVAFFLPQFTLPSASSVHGSVTSDWFCGLTWLAILSFHSFRRICRSITRIQPFGNYRTGIFRVANISLYCTRIYTKSSLKIYHCQSKHLTQERLRHPTDTRITCSCQMLPKCCWFWKCSWSYIWKARNDTSCKQQCGWILLEQNQYI